MSSYLVIARKWRPTVFDEIIGQDHVTRTLKNALSSGRLAQAYLFSGPRGVGKTTAARIMAKCLNCTAEAKLVPCNECSSCRSITDGSSVDVLEIDGASNRGVEDIEELRENIMYMPAGGRRKIYIIDEVHMLSKHAFNALLKTLEEPPPHVVFIFATTEARSIPPTILSRCQRYEFRRISVVKMEAHLKKILLTEKIDFDEDALFAIAREADGSLRDAESLLDQVLAFGGESVRLIDVTEALGLMDRTVLLELMRAIVDKKGGLSLNIIEKIYDFGYDLKKACGELLAIVRDMTAIKVTGGTTVIEAPDHELTALRDLAKVHTVEDLHILFLLLQKGYEGITRSAFARHSFEMTVLRASSFDSVRPVDELIKGLDALGRGAGGGRGPVERARDTGGRAGARGASNKGADDANSGFAASPKAAPGEGTQKAAPNSSQDLPWNRPAATALDRGFNSAAGASSPPDKGKVDSGHGPWASDKKAAGADMAPASSEEGAEGGGKAQDAAGMVMDTSDAYPGAAGSEMGVKGLINYVKKKESGALFSQLQSAVIDLKDKSVEIAATPQVLTVLEFKKARMEELFSEFLGRSVEVVFKTNSVSAAAVKDPVDDVRRILGGTVLEDGYTEGG